MAQAANPHPSLETAREEALPPARPMTLLVLEDNPTDYLLLAAELDAEPETQVQLTHAGDLSQGLELLRTHTFDAAVVDLGLPDSTGLETLVRLLGAAPQLPVIVLTGSREPGIATMLQRHGAADCIVKHAGMGWRVSRAVQSGIERRHAAAELDRQSVRLRSSESNTRAIIEASADAIVIAGRQGRIRFLNPAAEIMFGRPAAELLGSTFGFPLVSGGATELDVKRPDTTTGVAEMRVVELNWEGEPAYLATLHDVTERKRAHSEVQEANASLELRVRERTMALEEANRELEAFVYSISHDLRAPLRHIRGFAEMLAEQAGAQLDAEARGLLDRILRSSARMQALVQGLLDFSRLNRAALTLKPVELGPLVGELVEELATEAGPRHVQWNIGGLPVVQADAMLLRQVLTNLLSNALKFTRERNPAVIEVAAGREIAEGREPAAGQDSGGLVIGVRDNGVGFSMEAAGKLFGVFQRLHPAEHFEGTGIGLAIVHRIVQRHGGQVWAEAEPGRGAAFYFTLSAGSATTAPGESG